MLVMNTTWGRGRGRPALHAPEVGAIAGPSCSHGHGQTREWLTPVPEVPAGSSRGWG